MSDDAAARLGEELRSLAGSARDLGPAFGRAAQQFTEAAEDHFATDGGGAWPAWSDSYADRTRSTQLLVRDGDLLASLTDTGHGQHLRRITATSLDVGTTRPTANLHRNAGSGKMPRRDPMPDLHLFEDRWVNTLRAHLTSADIVRLGL